MGLQDREYMRERARQRARSGTIWNERKGRVELEGSSSLPRVFVSLWQKWLVLLCALLIGAPMVGAAKRQGWFPDFSAAQPFPQSGSVTVADSVGGQHPDSFLIVRTSQANAVVQLVAPDTGAHLLTIYVAANDSIRAPVPSGTFRVRLIEGQKWHGPERYFGPATSYQTVAEPMTFSRGNWHIIDLNRRPGGNLPTRTMLTSPQPLQVGQVP